MITKTVHDQNVEKKGIVCFFTKQRDSSGPNFGEKTALN